jgi:hypothetical protein
VTAGFGFGRRRGFGLGGGYGGRGWRHRYYATGLPGWMRDRYEYPAEEYPVAPVATRRMNRRSELTMLKDQARYCQDALKEINDRIEELEQTQSTKEE